MTKYVYIAFGASSPVILDETHPHKLQSCMFKAECGEGVLFKITSQTPIDIFEWQLPDVDHDWQPTSTEE